MTKRNEVKCPGCNKTIEPLDETNFDGEYLCDDQSSWIECEYCGYEFYIETHLTFTFEVDTERTEEHNEELCK